jgi:hypothetical protein
MKIGAKTVLAVLCIFLIAIVIGSSCTEATPPEQEEELYYLVGNFTEQGTVMTDAQQEAQTTFSGTIAFEVVSGPQGNLTISLDRVNLIADGVPTKMGDSGLIGLTLLADEYETEYDSQQGATRADFQANLHYELIDQIAGYPQLQQEGELDNFPSYTEEMAGNLTGAFPENLQAKDGDSAPFAGDIDLIAASPSPILGSLIRIRFHLEEVFVWSTTSCEAIRIQPVFIGTGPDDPNRTGTAFDTLMTNASELWDRCGTVRCLKFTVLEPIYLDKPAYKVLDNSTEATNLRAEVNVDNAVEIFVVGELSESLACAWGGGASFSSGTAAAKIVSCDQQLAVPCPCPVDCREFCPCGGCGVDPDTCGALNLYHLAHELGHTLDLYHPPDASSTADSIMEPSGFCCDNPDVQSAKNCRNADNPLLYSTTCSLVSCGGSPDIMD